MFDVTFWELNELPPVTRCSTARGSADHIGVVARVQVTPIENSGGLKEPESSLFSLILEFNNVHSRW